LLALQTGTQIRATPLRFVVDTATRFRSSYAYPIGLRRFYRPRPAGCKQQSKATKNGGALCHEGSTQNAINQCTLLPVLLALAHRNGNAYL
jgi:hypothetical protein